MGRGMVFRGRSRKASRRSSWSSKSFPWHLVERIGVYSQGYVQPSVERDAGRGAPAGDRDQSEIGIIEGEMAMIEFRTGDILQADAEALVNTVNCVGIMGRGIALQFKNAFPENFKAYAAPARARRCSRAGCSCSRPARSPIRSTSSTSRPSATGAARAGWRISTPGLKALVEEIREARHPLDRRPAARQRPRRAGLG